MNGLLASPPPRCEDGRIQHHAATIPWAVPLNDQAVKPDFKNTEIASVVAAGGASGTGLQKASVVATHLEPIVLELLKGRGVVNPTMAQIAKYVEGAVMTLDAFEAMTAGTAGAAA